MHKILFITLLFTGCISISKAQINAVYRISSFGQIGSVDSIQISSFGGSAFQSSSESSEVTVSPFLPTNELVTSLENELLENVNTQMYPNPVRDYLRISVPGTNLNLTIYNLLGEEIFKENLIFKESEIDLSFLEEGLYFIDIMDEKNKVLSISKIIKL